MEWKELEPKTIELRESLLKIMKEIERESGDPTPPVNETFKLAHELILNPQYDIVICGEVKKGKSSFLNAIIGKEILPVNVNVATSQVFRITNNPEESCFLQFTDGTLEKIAQDEITKYGSQVDADLNGEPVFNGRVLDYIQINTPMEFLPQGVSLVDTPGLGALYKSHESITQRYVRNAAAVVFIFDPENPMVQQEKSFLEKVLDITPFVLFVMTKIDSYSQEHWITQIRRNEELLENVFGNKPGFNAKIFPVSGKLLYKAANEEDEEMREARLLRSYFPEAKDELLRMMYKMVGLSRTGFAQNESEKQVIRCKLAIEERINITKTNSKKDQEDLLNKRKELHRLLETDWGPESLNRKKARQEIQDILTGVKSRAYVLSSSNGSLYTNYENMIDRLSSASECESFAKTFPTNFTNDASLQWRSIADDGQKKVSAVLDRFKIQMESATYQKIIEIEKNIDMKGLTRDDIINCYKSEFLNASLVGTLTSPLLLVFGIVLAPIVIPIMAIWAWFKGKEKIEQNKVRKYKEDLKKGLIKMVSELNSKLMYVHEGNRSIVDDFNVKVSAKADESFQKMYLAEKEKLKQTDGKLKEQSEKSAEEKKSELDRLLGMRAIWNTISRELSTTAERLNMIKLAFVEKQ